MSSLLISLRIIIYSIPVRLGTGVGLVRSLLCCVCHDVRRAVDDGCVTLLVLLNFGKAFDNISHSRLLVKLRSLGFGESALRWFFSYLTGRSQAVVNNAGGCSGWLTTATGVPQGSVLDPLLISDLSNI